MKEMYSWNSVGFISKQKLAFFMLLKHTWILFFFFLLVDHLKPPFTFWLVSMAQQ